MRNTIDFGIDLGTTNSAIAVLEGTQARVVKNNLNMEYTPSVVMINKNQRMLVGWTAKQRLESDPQDVKSEFKLQMGTDYTYTFESSGMVLTPEQLSAEVLKSLKNDVKQRLGEDISSAVITVPAAFELPQCEATKRAAQLAGIKTSPLIMEPTAAAMAYAFQEKINRVRWLVYDLGGGTFDAALIEVKDGEFRIINHGGDNHLGGKLVDWEIVDKILAPQVAQNYAIRDFSRANPKWKTAFSKLKSAAEEAKIALSTQESYWITIENLYREPDGSELSFEYELKRDEVVSLAYPYIKRTINICKQTIQQAGLRMGDVERVILVGGPTLAPYVRETLADPKTGLGLPLEFSIDPITVVAQGAAIFAGSQRTDLSEQITQVLRSTPEGQLAFFVKLEYDPIGLDEEPLVGGKIVASTEGYDFTNFFIEFENKTSKPVWRSGKIKVSPKGVFTATLFAQPDITNIYRIYLYDANGSLVESQPEQFEYRVGNKPGDQPLIHSIGIGLANNEVAWFLEKGSRLPARQKKTLRSNSTVMAGDERQSIRIPVIEGDNLRADRNRLIGTLVIPALGFRRNVPIGTEIEVFVEIDASRIVKASAYIPLLDQDFESVLDLRKPRISLESLRLEFNQQMERFESIRQKGFDLDDERSLSIIQSRIVDENMVENLRDALTAAVTDPDALDKAQYRLIDFKIALDEAEISQVLPLIIQEAQELIEQTAMYVDDHGDIETKKQFNYLAAELNNAIRSEKADLIRWRMNELNKFQFMLIRELPDFWVWMFEQLENDKDKMLNQNEAEKFFQRGKNAITKGDIEQLKNAVVNLVGLLPDELRGIRKDILGGGSSVIR